MEARAEEVRGGMLGLQNLYSFMAFMAYHMHSEAWAWISTYINALSDSIGDIYKNLDEHLEAQAENGCAGTCTARLPRRGA